MERKKMRCDICNCDKGLVIEDTEVFFRWRCSNCDAEKTIIRPNARDVRRSF